MRARILPPEEWSRVAGEGRPSLLPFVEPTNIAVVAVEDDAGSILASVQALRVTHLEGLWVAPEARGNAGVVRALLRQAFAVPRARGEAFAFGGAENGPAGEEMDGYLRRLGAVPVEAHFYALGVR